MSAFGQKRTEATEIHRPVSSLLGVVDCDKLPSDLCQQVEQDIEEKQFSFVSMAEAFRSSLPVLVSLNPPPEKA
jgi:hypothetical protein